MIHRAPSGGSTSPCGFMVVKPEPAAFPVALAEVQGQMLKSVSLQKFYPLSASAEIVSNLEVF